MTDFATDRVERFLEAWARKRDAMDEVYPLHMFVEEDEGRSLLASDLRELLDHIAALQDRIDELPEGGCETCGAVRCCCAWDTSTSVCKYHSDLAKKAAKDG